MPESLPVSGWNMLLLACDMTGVKLCIAVAADRPGCGIPFILRDEPQDPGLVSNITDDLTIYF